MERLKIIQENNQPGAGITIAQYDLEMRGGGELMGAEQSGFLQNIGYEMYFEFLRENISQLKEEKTFPPEPDLQFKQPAFIPRSYIPHEKVRLVFYKKLAAAQSETEIEKIKIELEDFAGPLLEPIENLILLSDLPKEMQRAMARQAEAERERRAKVISAEGEFQRAAKLKEASEVISSSPAAIQLAYLQALNEISSEGSKTIVFPIPMNLLEAFQQHSKKNDT